ncbi:hypothetical protein TRAPUB_4245 [Trametes pubescens]|uniref:Uncharacterized protein n=1 Tax=Trametes pubescens TaxID=154538 RepID=A0A1M2VBL9_TRAPU|nr:hypothetical protein TRAPUB_4245 [Trametes pubescens]
MLAGLYFQSVRDVLSEGPLSPTFELVAGETGEEVMGTAFFAGGVRRRVSEEV